MFRRFTKTLAVLIISIVVVPTSMIAIALAIVLFTPVPVTIPQRKVQQAVLPSFVYDRNGQLIKVFKRVESNIPITKADLPRDLRRAVVAAEDRRFYTHTGVDIKGLARALKRDVNKGQAEQGASTITQQLVKTVYYPDDSTDVLTDTTSNVVTKNFNRVWRKLRLAVIANRLDRKLSKEDILFEYLNNIFLGNGAYGVGAAAQAYFRKPVKDLTLSESATLAGIIPAPSKYEPRGNLSSAEFKRKATLKQMLEVGYITTQQFNEAIAQELWLDVDGPPPPAQPVTLVFGPGETADKYPYFVDYVRRYLIAKYGEEMLYTGGLQIRTTLDPKLQADAEETAKSSLAGTNPLLDMSIVSVQPLTGFVQALVGGRNFVAGQVNLALGNCPSDAKLLRILKGSKPKLPPSCSGANETYVDGGGSGRSPGSSFKPIALAEAFRQGLPPTEVFSGAKYIDPRCGKKITRGCTISNYEGAAYGPVDLRQMTIRSVNTAYARLSFEVLGVENVAKMAQRLGITSAWFDPNRHGPSYVLGGIDVSPLEMAAAYSVFAGRGLRAAATPILTVIDREGRTVEDNEVRQPKRVLTQTVADNVTNVLTGVVNEGTGKRAALGDRPVAGKTGTSQGNGNAWFVGYTPTLATAVWIGYRDRPRKVIVRGAVIAGGTLPALTWSRYMRKAMEGVPPTEFDEPAPIERPVKLSVKEIVAKKERKGIDLGPRRPVGGTGERTFVQSAKASPPPPPVDPQLPALAAPPTLPPVTFAPPSPNASTTAEPPPTTAPR
jgi:penicillin-binding protein 1A